jgi:hypothetical protein
LRELVDSLVELDPASGGRIVEATKADFKCAFVVYWGKIILSILESSMLERIHRFHDKLRFEDAFSIIGKLSVAVRVFVLLAWTVRLIKLIATRTSLVGEDDDAFSVGLQQ